MVQPVGNVLGRNPAGCAVFHQPDVLQVRHLGTAHPLIDPAHHIAKNALGVVLDLAQALVIGPFAIGGQRNVQHCIHIGAPPARLQPGLYGEDIDLVIMQRVQRCRCWTGHPGTGRARLGVFDLLFQHRRHQVGHRPHALADLRAALQPTFQPDINVLVLIGTDPGLALDEVLAAEWPGFH